MIQSPVFRWILRLIPAIIFLQTLYFKFTAAPESVFIFESLGLEPHGRIGIGILELIASLLILYPRTTWMGAILGLGIISGAIVSHLTQLGIEVQGDGGALFYMAVVIFICCLGLIWVEKENIPFISK